MENEKQELERKSEKFNKNRKLYKWDILFPLVAGMSVPIGAFLLLNCFRAFDVEPFSLVKNTIFGPITGGQFFIGGVATICSFFGGIFSLFNYAEYKNKVKNENAIKTSIEYLNGALEKAKEDLNEMKKQKTEENKNKDLE